MAPYYPGQIIKFPLPLDLAGFVSNGSTARESEYDEVVYDYNSMTYKTTSQTREIEKLKEELEEKKKQKAKDLKNIIGYFYKKR